MAKNVIVIILVGVPAIILLSVAIEPSAGVQVILREVRLPFSRQLGLPLKLGQLREYIVPSACSATAEQLGTRGWSGGLSPHAGILVPESASESSAGSVVRNAINPHFDPSIWVQPPLEPPQLRPPVVRMLRARSREPSGFVGRVSPAAAANSDWRTGVPVTLPNRANGNAMAGVKITPEGRRASGGRRQ